MQGYREMVFEGSLPVVKAFLAGLYRGRRWTGGFLMSQESGVIAESQGHRLLERLRLERDLTHVLVEERYAAAVGEAAREAREQSGVTLRAERRIQSASFAYRFETYNQAVARRIRRLFSERPESLALADLEEREEVHPERRGTEVYAPAHEFVYSGCGTASGPPADVLAFRAQLERLEWAKVESVRLQYAR